MKRTALTRLASAIAAAVPAAALTASVPVTPASIPREQIPPFGVVCPWSGLKDLGVSWVRCGAGATALGNWADIHKGPGVFNWKGSDEELNGICAQEGLSPLVILGYTPTWLATAEKDAQATPPRDYLQYADFTRTCVGRYHRSVRFWEIWNEEDIGFFKGTQQDYANLLKTGCIAAKTADPSCRVLLGGLAGVNLPYLSQLLENGAAGYFDVLGLHPYQWGQTFDDRAFITQLLDARRLLNRHGCADRPLWLTELGWSTGDSTITPDAQARLLTACMTTTLTLRRIGVERVFWYTVKDWGGPGYGLYDNDGKPKPAWQACQTVTRRLNGTRYEGRQYLGPDVRLHVFRNPDGSQTGVLWSSGLKKISVKVRLAPQRSSVHVEGHLGQSLGTLEVSTGILDMEAAPEPVYISGRFRDISLDWQRGWPVCNPSRKGVRPRGVWMTLRPQSGTSRVYVVRGGQGRVALDVQNQTAHGVRLRLCYRLQGCSGGGRLNVALPARSQRRLVLPFSVPASQPLGLRMLSVKDLSGSAPAVTTPVRVADGPVVEFLGNSHIEENLMSGENTCNGAPSIRFGSNWTYRIPLRGKGPVKVSARLGASGETPWKMLSSTDGVHYQPLLAGKSRLAWRSADVEAPGQVLWLHCEGDDMQLGELIVERAKASSHP